MLALWVVVVDAGKLEKPLCLRLQMLLNSDAAISCLSLDPF
jgi:hypothetical protein